VTYSSGTTRLEEILKLVEFIPISCCIPTSGKLTEGITIDSKFTLEGGKGSSSFRNLVRMINNELLKPQIIWKQVLLFERRYNQLIEIGCSYPVEYLLFDFCLAALENDYVDAKLFLEHSYHILGMNKSFNLVLSVILNEHLTEDPDVRQLLTLLAKGFMPRNADTYLESYGEEYKVRFEIYQEEFRKIRHLLLY